VVRHVASFQLANAERFLLEDNTFTVKLKASAMRNHELQARGSGLGL